MRILLDQNVPKGVSRILSDHDVTAARQLGWDRYSNGQLIAAAEEAGYAVLITADQNLEYQRGIAGRRPSVVVLPTNSWSVLQRNADRIVSALNGCDSGSFVNVRIASERVRRTRLQTFER